MVTYTEGVFESLSEPGGRGPNERRHSTETSGLLNVMCCRDIDPFVCAVPVSDSEKVYAAAVKPSTCNYGIHRSVAHQHSVLAWSGIVC